MPGKEASAVKAALAGRGINVSVTTPDSIRLDAERRSLHDQLRLSVHHFKTEEESDGAVDGLVTLHGSR